MLKKLLYISNLSQNSQTGGANAVNYHTYKELQKYFECTYVQINPTEPLLDKRWSQLRRKVLRLPGRFNFFSEGRLKTIAQQFEAIPDGYDLVFFRGFTPWVLCQPKVPYVAYNDVHFLQYFKNTFQPKTFITADINRIAAQEQRWLTQASSVAFESTWGAERCVADYNLDTAKTRAVGRGGHMPLPKVDRYDGGFDLVVIANHFYQKGGDLVFEAFKQLRPKYPQLVLHIVGGHPGEAVAGTPGVVYHGYLYKERAEDLEQLTQLLSKAFLLMHITREDTNPLVITEAGYFGCPTISVANFAIPELVKHNITGILLPYIPESVTVAEAIQQLLVNPTMYQQIRRDTLIFNRSQYSWGSIGQALKNMINNACQ